jgi:YbbR domain-containing protein
MWAYLYQKSNKMRTKVIFLFIALSVLAVTDGLASGKGSKPSGPGNQLSLSGVVLDKNSSERLAGVTIKITSTDQKIYSDIKGEFTLEGIAPGTYKVKVNCISYKDKEITIKIMKSQQEKLEIYLNPIEP